MVGRFNKLVQKGSVAEYIAEFEELRGYVLTHHNVHTPDFYLSSFISGLRADIQQALYVYKPRTLNEAMEKAREQETLIELLDKRVKTPFKTATMPTKPAPAWISPKPATSSTSSSTPQQTSISKLPEIKRITPQEMAKRREKGLCYNCDEVYSRGHKCQRPQLYLMEGDDMEEPEIEVTLETDSEVGISIHALQGTQGLHTLKIEGHIKRLPVTMLVDTGSTHNFISQALVKKLGIPTSTCTTMKVTLADGSQSQCTKIVPSLKWLAGNIIFQSEFLVLPLGGYDSILGIQWLQQVSPVCFDFSAQEMSVNWQNKKVILPQSTKLADSSNLVLDKDKLGPVGE